MNKGLHRIPSGGPLIPWGLAPLLVFLSTGPAQAGDLNASLVVQVIAGDSQLSVSQVLEIRPGDDTATSGTWTFPLLLPDRGPLPTMNRRSATHPGGLETRASGGASFLFGPDGLKVKGVPSSRGGLRAQVKYAIPVDAQALVFSTRPAFDLDGVRFITRRNPSYGIQLRPLVPYTYQEETEEEGTWQTMTATRPIRAGSVLSLSAGHLPSAFGPYRNTGIALVVLAAVILGIIMLSRRKESRTP